LEQISSFDKVRKTVDAMSKVRLGIVGFGRLGSIHAANITQSEIAELFAVCDLDTEALVRANQKYSCPTFSDIDEFLKQPLDGVIITSNTHLHIDHIRRVAKAGIHIFTEKPIGLTLDETDVALQEVVNSGINFQIGFQRRWDPRFISAKNAIVAGKIGTPVLYKAYGRDPNASNPKNWGLDKNGGLFLNAAIHDYDAARFLLGLDPTEISASGAALVYPELKKHGDIDTCSSTLYFGDSAMAITEWSRYATYGYDIYAEVVGTDGVIQIGRTKKSTVTILQKNDQAPIVLDEFRNAYRLELDGFAQSIMDNKLSTPGVEDARIALNIALSARLSHNHGGKKVVIKKLTSLRSRENDR
jgi:predicted dehydrogenase